MNAVEIDRVTKTYRTPAGTQTAVDDLSLTVPAGSIYGFIGPNGSGKTTTLRMIMRIIMPDAGRVAVLGGEARGSADDRIGFLPEERGLYKKMKLRDALCFFAKLKSVRRPGPLVDEWLGKLGLAGHAGKKIEELSKGMGQKAQFIAAVVAKPELAILDEPFSGLDPVNRDVLRDAILDLHRGGTTVIFSTHDMGVAEQLCDRVFMIHLGRKVLDGTMDEIRRNHAERAWRIGFETLPPDAAGRLPEVQELVVEGNTALVELRPGADSQAFLAGALRLGRVARFEPAQSLHDIFKRIAKPEAETAAAA